MGEYWPNGDFGEYGDIHPSIWQKYNCNPHYGDKLVLINKQHGIYIAQRAPRNQEKPNNNNGRLIPVFFVLLVIGFLLGYFGVN
jgi:hypothetical protein